MIIKNAELSEKYELLKLVNNKQSHTKHQNQAAHLNEMSIDSIEHEDNIKQNHSFQNSDETKALRDELNEKNKVLLFFVNNFNPKIIQKSNVYDKLILKGN